MLLNKQKVFHTALFVFIATICICIYWTGLYGPLVLDDMANLGVFFNSNFSSNDIVPNLKSFSGVLGRPVSMLSFILNTLVSEDLFFWKATNLAIHILCGGLVYILVHQLNRFVSGSESRLLPLVVMSIWLFHPLHVSTVLYTVQRMTQLSTLFTLAALIAYFYARERQRRGKNYRLLQFVAWVIFFPLAVFSKENALLFPALIVLFEVYFFKQKEFCTKHLILLIFGSVFLAAGLTVFFWESVISEWYAVRNFSLYERLLTESRIVISYLKMLILPAQSSMGFIHDDVQISTGIFQPIATLWSLLSIFAALVIALWTRGRIPLLGFGISFFLVGHLMESTLLPLELMYEHRNYLPSLGIFISVVAIATHYFNSSKMLFIITPLIISLLVFTTWLRADTWSSYERLFYHMEMVHPDSERLTLLKVMQFSNAGQYDLAREELKIHHSLGAELNRVYLTCLEDKELKGEVDAFKIQNYRIVDTYATMQIIDLANLGLDKKCNFSKEAFVELIDKVLSLNVVHTTSRVTIMMYKAHYLWELKKHTAALDELQKAYELDNKNPITLLLSCEWALQIEDSEVINNVCETGIEIAKKNKFRYGQLGMEVEKLLQQKGQKLGMSLIN